MRGYDSGSHDVDANVDVDADGLRRQNIDHLKGLMTRSHYLETLIPHY